ncbi:CidA/LrgA family protein [Aliibacillus thermotolerans]|uniref:CidA/LrgA family protein n=1 Tax=Aliibacillus thermotolerans TaxID=1834418 RepID=A0ABW0U9T5_9BACI|nr:CidA/LrgA family protein [Aliibacillus thermotolerans]MDA3129752.1 CidA/LrgA family protein [Aliibacillus thermotolerans]
MDVWRIVVHIAILYGFYYIGAALQTWLDIAVPGSILGMFLLLLLLFTKVIRPEWIAKGTTLILAHMPLLFLPVTAGVIVYLDLFKGSGIFMIIVVYVSTLIVMLSTAWIAQTLINRGEKNG